jgi:hypothetical protein
MALMCQPGQHILDHGLPALCGRVWLEHIHIDLCVFAGDKPVQGGIAIFEGLFYGRSECRGRAGGQSGDNTREGGSDIHVTLTLCCSSRQVVVADEQLNGTDMIDEFLGERQRVTCQT